MIHPGLYSPPYLHLAATRQLPALQQYEYRQKELVPNRRLLVPAGPAATSCNGTSHVAHLPHDKETQMRRPPL